VIRRYVRPICVLSLVCFLALPASAYVETREPSRFDRLVIFDPGTSLGVVAETPEEIAGFDAERAGWSAFRSAHGSGWDVRIDRRSGSPVLVTGPGIPWYDPATVPTLEALEAKARAFLSSNGVLLHVDPRQLVLEPAGSGGTSPDHFELLFNRVIDGVPVEGSRLRFFINHGSMVAFGADRWGPLARAPRALVSAGTARQLLYTYMGVLPSDVVTEPAAPVQTIVPSAPSGTEYGAYRGHAGAGTAFHLAWTFVVEVEGERGRWVGKVDAVTGAILALYDDIRYAQVKGGVFPMSQDGSGFDSVEQVGFPMPYVNVTVNGVPATAGDMGGFDCSSAGATATTALAGPYLRVNDACGPVSQSTTCDSDLDLLSGPAGQTNCAVPPGSSAGNTHPSRSGYYTVNRINERVRHWLPGNAWLNGQITLNSNVNATCNATWGGTLNMYRAGNGCGNTAELAGIITHEWGHGLDENDGGGYDDPSEGYADVVALMHVHESCNGRGFNLAGGNCGGYGDACLSCTGVRDADWDKHTSHTPATPQGFVTNNCGNGDGPCGREQHCEGYVVGETLWDLAVRDLPASGLDAATSWHVAEKLWFMSRQGSGGNAYNCALPSSDGCNAGSWFNDLRNVDDDDGNLANGTPHAAAIFAAFNRHKIACGAAADPSNQSTSACAALATPVLTASPGAKEVSLSWTPVPNAVSYAVLRNEVSCADSHHVIAIVPAPTTTYIDDQLPNGLALNYAVHAIGASSACEGALSSCQTATPLPHLGEVLLDRGRYACADAIQVKVLDLDLNHDPFAIETVQVTVSSSSEIVPETITLTETGAATAQFAATLPTAGGAAVPGDGILQVASGDILTVTYHDVNDDNGGQVNVFKDAVADCAGPGLTNIRVTDVTDDSAIVRWDSDELSTSRVEWGTTPALGTVVTDGTLVSAHALTLRPILECGKVYFRVSSTDAQGNVRVADIGGSPYALSAGIIPSFFKDTFEASAGWTLEGDWQIQAPQGLGNGPDPSLAFEGTKVLGQDLSGLGAHPGDYENGTTFRAISPLINATSLTGALLKFRRNLHVGGTAISSIEVRKNGTWNSVWNSPAPFGVNDASWSLQTVDISAFADANNQLQIAFKQTGGLVSSIRSGWNVDRFVVKSASQPDYTACGGCGAAPSFAGATGAVDLSGCGDTGIQVSWQGAPSWGSGGGGTYVVYRDVSPAFVPSAANRIATGVAGTSYLDAAAPNGVQLFYIVQAENNETCSSGPGNGGVVDGNTVRVAARDDLGQPVPGDVGATVLGNNVNDAHVRMSWSAAANAARYHVYRADAPSGPFAQIGDVPGLVFEDKDELGNAAPRYYLVRAADSCGNEGP